MWVSVGYARVIESMEKEHNKMQLTFPTGGLAWLFLLLKHVAAVPLFAPVLLRGEEGHCFIFSSNFLSQFQQLSCPSQIHLVRLRLTDFVCAQLVFGGWPALLANVASAEKSTRREPAATKERAQQRHQKTRYSSPNTVLTLCPKLDPHFTVIYFPETWGGPAPLTNAPENAWWQ